MKHFFGLMAGILILAACNSGTDKQADGGADTAATTSDTIVTFTPVDTSSEFIEIFSSNLQPWLERTTRENTLRLDNFRYVDNWVEDSLIVSPANLNADFYKTYKQVLIFSPDSSKVLDMGSYGAMPSKNSKGQATVVQGEPDSEIAVLDRLTRQRRRIFFFGPGTSVEQGFWMNDTTIVLAGKSEEQPDQIKPVIWTVRLEKDGNLYKRYEPKK